MTASSASSCTCTLLVLLLPLLFFVHHSSCAALPPPAGTTPPACFSSMSQLTKDINYLGVSLKKKNCSMNCSSLNITDTACQCFNLSVSQDCRPLDFLRSGLQTLQLRRLDRTVDVLLRRLTRLSTDCKGKATFCSLSVPSEVLISPTIFLERMKKLMEEYAALNAQ